MPEFDKSAQELSQVCKALGHPARAQIIHLLIEQEKCISGDLADRLPLAASTISEHLRILKSAGLVKGSIDGPRRSYCIDKQALSQFQELVKKLTKKEESYGSF